MASPHASSFICLPNSNNSDVLHAYTVYFSTCVFSALIGAVGAVIFLVQVIHNSRRHPNSSVSQKWILIMLACSDLLADIGVIGRSAYWLVYWLPRHSRLEKAELTTHLPDAVGGAVVENWVFFWYLATYFWTFFFAVDVYNSKHGGRWRLLCSHLFTWFFCFLFMAGSAASLWSCPPYLSCSEGKWCIISHFLSMMGPVFIFMMALPVFYLSTWRQMNKNALTSGGGVSGPVADIWRCEKILSKRKILGIILVFYICWSVNVLDGILLIVAHALDTPLHAILLTHLFDYKYIYGIWILEALLNPLQGMLNAVAYGGVFQMCHGCLRHSLISSSSASHETRGYSWSGEYIDVDFRVGRGRIHSKRSHTHTPPITRAK